MPLVPVLAVAAAPPAPAPAPVTAVRAALGLPPRLARAFVLVFLLLRFDRLEGLGFRLGHLSDRDSAARDRTVLHRRAALEAEAGTVLRRFAAQRDGQAEAILQLRQMPALLVQHIERHLLARAHQKMVAAVSEQMILQSAQDLQ